MINTTTEAVVELESAIRVWASAAEETTARASTALLRLVAQAESELQRRANRVRALEAALSRTSPRARAAVLAELRIANAELDGARRALHEAQAAQQRMQILHRRMNEAVKTRVARASIALKRKLSALRRYEERSAKDGAAPRSRAGLMKEAVIFGVSAVGAVTPFSPGIPPHGSQAGTTPPTSQHAKAGAAALGRVEHYRLEEARRELDETYTDDRVMEAREMATRTARGGSGD